jgi:hypothetical protein
MSSPATGRAFGRVGCYIIDGDFVCAQTSLDVTLGDALPVFEPGPIGFEEVGTCHAPT